MKNQTKKSAVDLTDLAYGIIILGITVAIGATILTKFSVSRVDSLPTFNTINETVTTVTASGETLSQPWVTSITRAVNATGGQTIAPGNYTLTVNPDTGSSVIKSITSGHYNNTNWKVTYISRNLSDQQYAVPNSAAVGLGEYANWFDIIVIIGIAAVIIGLIFMAFGNRDTGTSASY